jgi:hypothetical protein
VANFEEQNQFVLLTDVPSNSNMEANLYVSSDLGLTFSAAEFPFQGSNNHFSVVDASEDFLLVAVDHNRTRVEGSTAVLFYPTINGDAPWNVTAYRALFSEVLPLQGLGTPRGSLVYDSGNNLGCPGSRMSAGQPNGPFYLILRRGQCKFYLKAQMAESMGAIGVIIINTMDTERLYMQAPDGINMPNITVVIISSTDGTALLNHHTADPNMEVSFSESEMRETVLFRQSNLYASDPSGTKFSIALKNVLYESAADTGAISNAYTDVYKVQSMNGTYIANYRNSSDNRELTAITYVFAPWASLHILRGVVTTIA